MSALLHENEPVVPRKHDIALAGESSKILATLVPKKEQDFHMVVKVDKREEEIILPFSAIKLLLQILTQMAEGNAVTLIPIHAELTTQEAANILNVSRPYLIKLLEKGKIPYHMVGTHRRIHFRDIWKFKNQADGISQKGLEELVQQAQELDFGY